MPTYKIKAPDGNTYSIDGPEGASDAQVRAKVLEQHPNAGAAPPKATGVSTGGSTLQIGPFDTKIPISADVENYLAGAGAALTDKVLGAKQLAASFGFGNADELNKQAAEKAALDKPLLDTKAGLAGHFTGGLAADAPVAMATGGATFLPKVVGSAVTGMVSNATNPDENYGLGKQLAQGAAFGVGGDVAGRTVGRVIRPMQKLLPEAVQEQVARIKDAPALIAENLTNNPIVRAMTNALAQIPVAGKGVQGARDANAEWITRMITGEAGHEVPQLTDAAAKFLHDRLNAQGNVFRQGQMPLTGARKDVLQAVTDQAEAINALGVGKPVTQAANFLRETRPPPGVATGAPYTPIIKADTGMTLRDELGDQAYRAQNDISATTAKAVKDAVERNLETKYGPAFPQWLKEYGTSKDLRKVEDQLRSGYVLPEKYAAAMDTPIEHMTDFQKTVRAAGARMATPTATENRSLMVRLLMGSPLVGAGGAAFASGIPAGALVGGGTLGLAHFLLGTPMGGRYLTGQAESKVGKYLQDPKTLERIRRLSTLLGATTAD